MKFWDKIIQKNMELVKKLGENAVTTYDGNCHERSKGQGFWKNG